MKRQRKSARLRRGFESGVAIQDLAGAKNIYSEHVLEAIRYHLLDRQLWRKFGIKVREYTPLFVIYLSAITFILISQTNGSVVSILA
jgi:hypothetical protein